MTTSPSGTRLRAKVVMFVVDGSTESRANYTTELRDADLLVDEVGSLAVAIALVPRIAPDIVVLERELPDGEAWDFARYMRSNESLRRIPIIGFAAKTEGRADIENALVAGCDVFLEKPCAPNLLLRHVQGLLGLPLEEDRKLA